MEAIMRNLQRTLDAQAAEVSRSAPQVLPSPSVRFADVPETPAAESAPVGQPLKTKSSLKSSLKASQLERTNRKRARESETAQTGAAVAASAQPKKVVLGDEPPAKKTARKPPVNPFLKKSMASPQKVHAGVRETLSSLSKSPAAKAILSKTRDKKLF